jgi:tetratricopeptide (TPR) repeat protein
MEGKKYIKSLIMLFGCLLIIAQTSFSQSLYSDKIYEAYARGKMDVWYEVMTAYETEIIDKTQDQELVLINYYYGYTGWLISVEKDDLAEEYIEKSEKILNKISAKDPYNATVLAYKGAFIAYEIGLSTYKAIYLGRTSMQFIEDALKIEPENIQAHIEMGNAMYYCPKTFGGDKNLAINHYKLAAKYMEEKQLTINNWMYLNVMTALGQAYEATEQIQHAKLCYEKILRVKPDFMWVGEELYPDMLKRYNL